MSIKLNRKGAGLAGEDRVKENQNLEMIEQEFARVLQEVTSANSLSNNVQTQLNTLVVQGDSSPQATQASVGADGADYGGSLKARLDAEYNRTATRLANKADESEVVKKGAVTLNDFDEPTRAAIQGLEPGEINAVLGVGNVTPLNTNFFQLSKNLFDKSKIVSGNLSNTTGQTTTSADYVTSDFTPVESNTAYTISRAFRVVYYDANKSYISGDLQAAVQNYTFTTPSNTAFIRYSIRTTTEDLNAFMVVKGTQMIPFVAFGADVIPKDKLEKPVELKRENLANVFSLGSDLPNGTDLNTVVKEGFSTGVANGGYVNAPAGLPSNRAFSFQNIPVYSGGNRWFLQKAIDFTQPFRKYVRKLDATGSGTTAWVEDTVPNTKPDLVSGTNLNNVLGEGNYLGIGTNTYTNIPTAMQGVSFFLDVLVYGYVSQNFIIQRLTSFFDESIVYTRMVKSGTPTEWKREKSGDASGLPLADKNGVCFGDSITEFGNYPDVMSQRTGAEFLNCGFGGCRMANHTNAFYDPFSMTKLADALVSGDFSLQQAQIDDLNNPFSANFKANFEKLKTLDLSLVDFVTIFFGTNDYAGTSDGSVPLGLDADYGSATFKGAINYVIDKLMTAYPHLKIVFFAPMWRENPTSLTGGESDTTPNGDGVYLVEYANAVVERANAHHLPALNLYKTAGINKYNRDTFLVDRVHPNSYGYEHIGNKGGAFLLSEF